MDNITKEHVDYLKSALVKPKSTFSSDVIVIEEILNDKEDNSSASNGSSREGQNKMKRTLKLRHILMIALGNCVGTGIFLNSGRNVAEGGPGGALIAYSIVGFLIYCIMTCVGEMSTYLPVSGSFFQFASRFVDRSLGFALGVNYWWITVSLAVELTSAANVIKFWKPVLPDAVWASIFWVVLVAINLMAVRLFGEIEYWFTAIKLLTVIALMIVAILVSTGAANGHKIGFNYWKDPGAFTNGGLGIANVILQAGYTFLGTESITLAAGEAEDPTRTIPKAIKTCFWRVVIFFISTIFLIGLCLPHNEPRLSFSSSNPATSAFTLIFEKAGVTIGAHIINVIILISILSAANAVIYAGSRCIVGIAQDGVAPKFLTRINRFGSPYLAVLAATLFAFICIFMSTYSAGVVLVWCLNLSSIAGFITWASIPIIQLRFRKGYVYQGKDLNELVYKASFYPYSSIIGILLSVIIILGQGYVSFYPEWNAVKFVSCYIGLLPFTLSYFIHKLVTKSKLVPLGEIDYETGRVDQFDSAIDEKKRNRKFILKICNPFKFKGSN